VLRRGRRLSVQPVEEAHFKEVVRLAGATIPV
jgi:predicted RNA-binding protein with PUA-like domain